MQPIRIGAPGSSKILAIDVDRYLVTVGGKKLEVSLPEYILLERLFLSRNHFETKRGLLVALFHDENTRECRLRVIVHRLQKKLFVASGGESFVRMRSEKGLNGYGFFLPIIQEQVVEPLALAA